MPTMANGRENGGLMRHTIGLNIFVYDGFVRDNDCILLTPKPIIMDIKRELPSHLTKSYRNNQIKE
ncbi:hypothetical protein ID0233_11790 [Helicobacter pylori]